MVKSKKAMSLILSLAMVGTVFGAGGINAKAFGHDDIPPDLIPPAEISVNYNQEYIDNILGEINSLLAQMTKEENAGQKTSLTIKGISSLPVEVMKALEGKNIDVYLQFSEDDGTIRNIFIPAGEASCEGVEGDTCGTDYLLSKYIDMNNPPVFYETTGKETVAELATIMGCDVLSLQTSNPTLPFSAFSSSERCSTGTTVVAPRNSAIGMNSNPIQQFSNASEFINFAVEASTASNAVTAAANNKMSVATSAVVPLNLEDIHKMEKHAEKLLSINDNNAKKVASYSIYSSTSIDVSECGKKTNLSWKNINSTELPKNAKLKVIVYNVADGIYTLNASVDEFGNIIIHDFIVRREKSNIVIYQLE